MIGPEGITGTAGRIENSQVAVYLAYASPAGHALIDRALYLPASWTDDPDRCAAAGIPKGTEFATKPALATAMISAALDAGQNTVTGDAGEAESYLRWVGCPRPFGVGVHGGRRFR